MPLYYGPHILGPIFQGGGSSKVASTIAGVEVTSIMTAVNVAATYFGFRYIDRIGRRKLALGGFLGMAIFALVAAAGLGFASGDFRLVLVMVGLDFFIASFAVGVGGTGWLLQGEVFPTAVRGQAAVHRRDRRLARELCANRGLPGLELRASDWGGCSSASPDCAWSRSPSLPDSCRRPRAYRSSRSRPSSETRRAGGGSSKREPRSDHRTRALGATQQARGERCSR